MSQVRSGLSYTKSHEWVRLLPDGRVEIGITDYAQHALGDLVFVELPEVGRSLEAGGASAVVESVKAASDVYSPVSGTVVEVNGELGTTPELINQDCYGRGWMIRLQADDPDRLRALLDAEGYQKLLGEGA